jgi:hypothetical protein
MREGTFPRSTPPAAGFAGAGSGAPHGLLSVADEPQGSNIVLLLCVTGAGRVAVGEVLGGWLDRLKAEPKSLLFCRLGDVTLGAVAGAGAAVTDAGADDHPPKSSLLNKSAGIDAAGLEAGAGAALGGGGDAGVAV